MIASQPVSTHQEGEVDLIALWRVLWGYKFLVAAIVVVCALVALYFALTAPLIYRAQVAMTHVQDGGMSSASALASQFGGLASLAGVNLGASGEEREAQAVLTSRRLAEEFIKRNGLLPELSKNASKPMTVWNAVEKFRRSVLVVREDKRTGVTTVAMSWTDAATAARWANSFVTLANEIIRTRDLDNSNRNLAYLNEQLARTNVVELQRVLYNLIESETKTLMLANARAEYAFSIVDPAVAPELRISPNRKMIVLIGVVLGLVIGLIVAFSHNMLRLKRSAAPDDDRLP